MDGSECILKHAETSSVFNFTEPGMQVKSHTLMMLYLFASLLTQLGLQSSLIQNWLREAPQEGRRMLLSVSLT